MARKDIHRDEYLLAFDVWLRVRLENCEEARFVPLFERDQRVWREAVEVARPNLPEGVAPIDTFCAVFDPLVPYTHGHPAQALRLAIDHSDLLCRLLYGGEALRTIRCPEHLGRWSGVEMPAHWPHTNRCPHGCGLTGWLVG